MLNQRKDTDHHHQKKESKGVRLLQTAQTPEGELIALAKSKNQILTAHTLRIIKECLELKGVTLAEFVEWVRPHLQRGIHNPSGFLISSARTFRQVSAPASPPPPAATALSATGPRCSECAGQGLILKKDGIVPCPNCSTPESRREWERKEQEHQRRAEAFRAEKDREPLGVPADVIPGVLVAR